MEMFLPPWMALLWTDGISEHFEVVKTNTSEKNEKETELERERERERAPFSLSYSFC